MDELGDIELEIVVRGEVVGATVDSEVVKLTGDLVLLGACEPHTLVTVVTVVGLPSGPVQ
jgi:hypothetical protein